MKINKISNISKVFLLLAAVLLVGSLFVAIWRIELEAPQYPEGLALLIYANKLGGDVDIINGLNHYIGMQTLHSENFIEFKLLTYFISAFALFSLIVVIVGKRALANTLLISFILFGILSMIDFYRWNYNYGHNLSEDAAIKVPGMSYQPPLIGYKQLLNFGAYSVPDIGGWFFIVAGILMLIVVIIENNLLAFLKKSKPSLLLIPFIFLLNSCKEIKPKPVKLNSDGCEYCKMTIVDSKFVSQIVNSKGKVYFFDDVKCLKNYLTKNEKLLKEKSYVSNYSLPNNFIEIGSATFITSESILSPMGGNIAAFVNEEQAKPYVEKFNASFTKWNN